jgi:hypothetical protein
MEFETQVKVKEQTKVPFVYCVRPVYSKSFSDESTKLTNISLTTNLITQEVYKFNKICTPKPNSRYGNVKSIVKMCSNSLALIELFKDCKILGDYNPKAKLTIGAFGLTSNNKAMTRIIEKSEKTILVSYNNLPDVNNLSNNITFDKFEVIVSQFSYSHNVHTGFYASNILRQILNAVTLQKEYGTLIIKFPNLSGKIIMELVMLISMFYENVKICKVHINSDNYLVCKKFNCTNLKYLDELIELSNKLETLQSAVKDKSESTSTKVTVPKNIFFFGADKELIKKLFQILYDLDKKEYRTNEASNEEKIAGYIDKYLN